ncbi:MAG: alpha/beta hydrolase [Alphaproteobacteria bacterium]|nr:alpha/beta hydrolase [Alphaproteobacteria bacterium]
MPDSPFHPELAAAARWLPHGLGHPWQRSLAVTLGSLAFRFARFPPEHAPLGEGAGVYFARVEGDRRPTLFWIHGGGLILGDARQDGPFLQRVQRELGVNVVSAQHRLAVEHPFPAPLDDCLSAYRWLLQQPWVDPAAILLGGQSAGGGLAAALAQRLRDLGEPLPRLQLLIYPMLDDRSSERPSPEARWLRVWDRRSNRYGWDSYLRGQDRAAPPPHAVPARTEDLAGLPPAWIGVGTLDLFHDEDLDYARRLEAAGVPVQLELVAGAFHGFDAVVKEAPVSRAFVAAQLAALRAHLPEPAAP